MLQERDHVNDPRTYSSRATYYMGTMFFASAKVKTYWYCTCIFQKLGFYTKLQRSYQRATRPSNGKLSPTTLQHATGLRPHPWNLMSRSLPHLSLSTLVFLGTTRYSQHGPDDSFVDIEGVRTIGRDDAFVVQDVSEETLPNEAVSVVRLQAVTLLASTDDAVRKCGLVTTQGSRHCRE